MSEYCQRAHCQTKIARSFQVTCKQCARCQRLFGNWNAKKED